MEFGDFKRTLEFAKCVESRNGRPPRDGEHFHHPQTSPPASSQAILSLHPEPSNPSSAFYHHSFAPLEFRINATIQHNVLFFNY